MLTLLRTDEYVVSEDKYINKLATLLHTKLLAQWDMETAEYRAYGRCYRNPSKIPNDNGFVPQVFKGGTEYDTVMANDKVTVVTFFGLGNREQYAGQNVVPVHLIVAVNLKRLWDVNYRADADVRRDVQNIVHNKYGFTITSIERGIENVYAEYTSTNLREKLKAKDMEPYHVFRINFELRYSINNDCVKKKSRPVVDVFDDTFDDTFA